MSIPLETLVHFSDYKNEKISSMQLTLDDNMNFIIYTDKNSNNEKGITIMLKDAITENIELKGFIAQDKLQALIKALNVMYRQSSV